MLTKVLPAIRGWLQRDDILPRLCPVTVSDTGEELGVPEQDTDICEWLQATLPRDCSRFTLPVYGTYQVEFPTVAGRARGKIALVTGAAQGFGFEIAQDLAQQGAWVMVADINPEGVHAATSKINTICRRAAATGVVVDVTSPTSLQAALGTIVTNYGGLDLLVSNAGVLRAGSVKELSEADFSFVTDVNYKGYFLCVQAVAPIMAQQHQTAPTHWFDIIQINSKSGLAGSNKNGAYAGSKFGGLGLTQSFALELVSDNIKVNAICPGNFYDGPLWSDPEKGLFRQYLDSGKVPGARTFADVKAHYEAQVPMRRGCTSAAVMKALYYVMEQDYETGQAIPVTGGQIMLS